MGAITTTFMIGENMIVISAEDLDDVLKYRWHLWDGYPYCHTVGKLHNFIVGARPDDVPADWVIDHANRNRFDASRSNLRWVSPDFNAWNRTIADPLHYRGVCKNRAKWRAVLSGESLGAYDTPYLAGYAYAKAVIRKWHWAKDSDLLFGPDKLSCEDLENITQELSTEVIVLPAPRNLPKGVSLNAAGSYCARYAGVWFGAFDTIEAAKAVYDKKVAEINLSDWQNHLKTRIPVDIEGNAILSLSGKWSHGKVALVPKQLWHQLTFKKSWHLNSRGYVRGDHSHTLHMVIMEYLQPNYDKTLSVDHINPYSKLDNRESNLRLATKSTQASNKKKRQGCSSQYLGVSWMKGNYWRATITKDGKTYSLGTYKNEKDAWDARQKKQKELYG